MTDLDEMDPTRRVPRLSPEGTVMTNEPDIDPARELREMALDAMSKEIDPH
jgi:hypothetical protein